MYLYCIVIVILYCPLKEAFLYIYIGISIGTQKKCPLSRGGEGDTSIFFTEMLVREQIPAAQKNRMTLNSSPKNRITQDAMFVKV